MNYGEFLKSIRYYNKIKQIEKIGITETTFCHSFVFNFSLECFFIYNNEGKELLSYFYNNEENNFYYKNCFKNIVVSKYLKGNLFECFFGKRKLILFKKHLVFILITKTKIKGSLIKFYLKFISTAYLNFIGENIGKENNLYYISNIFENFFIKYLTNKFIKMLKSLIFRPQKSSTQINFKNVIILDCKNNYTILFNLKKILNLKLEKKVDKESLLTKELLHNINEYKDYYSTKLILLSTYPRLYIITKYLKINDGIGVFEIYSSNKLSRSSNVYCEYELSFQKNKEEYISNLPISSNKNLNFIEKFLKLYYASSNKNLFSFSESNLDLIYFDSDYLSIIDDALKLRMTFENLISYLNKKLYIYFKNWEKNHIKNDNNNNLNYNLTIEKNEILNDLNVKEKNEETKINVSIIENNGLSDKIDKNFFEDQSEISDIEKKTENEAFGSIISNIIKDKISVINDLSGSIIEDNKSINKLNKNDILKDLQIKLIHYDENNYFSQTKNNNNLFSKTINVSQEKDSKNPLNLSSLINITNTNGNINKNNLIEKNDLSEFYGDKSSHEIISKSPTFADLNKRKKK